jgi:hypothetical protein
MKKSLKNLIIKIQENNTVLISEGFTVLKTIRGGKLVPTDNNGPQCTNTGTSCSGDNQHRCTNSTDCTGTTNTAICSNNTCAF